MRSTRSLRKDTSGSQHLFSPPGLLRWRKSCPTPRPWKPVSPVEIPAASLGFRSAASTDECC